MKDIKSEIQERLKSLISSALEKAIGEKAIEVKEVPDFYLEVPQDPGHGDFAANVAMMMARQARMSPKKIAEIIVKRLEAPGGEIEKVEVAGPGFINFYLKPTWANRVVFDILKEGKDFGRLNIGKGKKVQVEFVSANPTGPMHMGNARGAALGDALSSVLKMAGYDVTKEFYINDAGNQIENFGLSLEARYLELLGYESQIPEGGYHGEDVKEHMRNIIEEEGERFLHMDSPSRRAYFIDYALKRNIKRMKEDLENFGVHFDVWFSEKSLHDSGKVNEVIRLLTERGCTYEKDGALWFKASEFGAGKDEVLIRQNGIPTYFAADIAYHKDKFDRGFEWVIDIWGADHHGHVPRMKGALAALGYDPERFTVIIMQLVRLYRNGEVARMSKRTGRAVTLADIVEEVGKDAARFFFNMRSADTHLDFDLDLAIKQSDENPVYYVQYAHARICSILRQAAEQGVRLPDVNSLTPGEFSKYSNLLTEKAEIDLIKKLADFPGEIRIAATTLSPYRITVYSLELASAFHSFYNSCRVLSPDEDLTAARLMLAMAVRQVLRNAFNVLGISAPERM
ncbi:arginine--tRNA ligase [Thermoanaerobacterium sp. DL9XJH110]|uniref:arginine--tRNA ligase n=1 Tax=Thermoanaerobacterium sp. DL9XJH110 TaxID=3386643 RepID=UPI003BB7E56E